MNLFKKKNKNNQPQDHLLNTLMHTMNSNANMNGQQNNFNGFPDFNSPMNGGGGFPPFQGQSPMGQMPNQQMPNQQMPNQQMPNQQMPNQQMPNQQMQQGMPLYGSGLDFTANQQPVNQYQQGNQGVPYQQHGNVSPQTVNQAGYQPSPMSSPNMGGFQQTPVNNIQQTGYQEQVSFPQTQMSNQFTQNNLNQEFPFPQNMNEINDKINSIDLTMANDQFDNGAKFTIQEPKNLSEAKTIIYELIERIHFLESQAVSLQANYDTERQLSKKKLDAFDNQSKTLVGLIQEVMQQQKYRYEKEHGEISNLNFKDLIEFLKSNIKEALLTEKQKNAKLFSALTELETTNKRLESQLAHNNISTSDNTNANVFSNVTNVDKINAILGGREESKPKDGNNTNFKLPPENIQNSKPIVNNAIPSVPVNTPTEKASSGKISEIKQDIQTFSADAKDVVLQKTEEEILKAIGDTGVDNHDNLVKELENLQGNLSATSFKSMLYNHRKKLIDKGLLETVAIELPMKGYNKVELFKLSNKGIAAYQQLFRKQPSESNMVKRKNQHTSYEHSFVIDKIGEHLLLNKYEVITDEKSLRFPVEVNGNSHHLEMDLVCKKGDQSFYVEVEMGTTSDKDFLMKIDKNYAFSIENKNPIIFVYPSKKKAEEGMNKVNNWLQARGGYKKIHPQKNFKIILTYFEEVKSNVWLTKPEFFIDLTI